jgi:hypothetical protein
MFINIHSDIVFLVMPRVPAMMIVQHGGAFMALQSELLEVTATKIGRALFGSALHGVLGEMLQTTIDQAVGEVLKLDLINSEIFLNAQKKVMGYLLENQFVKVLPDKRMVKLHYRGRQFHRPVRCLLEQMEAAFIGGMKGAATACGDLVPLFC